MNLWVHAVSVAENSVGWAVKAAATRLAHDTGFLWLCAPAHFRRTDMYMDGIGIQERTRHLSDNLWDTLTLGIFGAWIIFIGPFTSWMFIIHRFSWQTPTTEFDWGLAIIISVASVAVGLKMHLPHHRAMTALKRHRKNMERETARRGKGWGRS